MTASEVADNATIVRNYLGVPVPKVLAWSSKAATNGIGAEYIIMETAQGVQLSNVWSDLNARKKKKYCQLDSICRAKNSSMPNSRSMVAFTTRMTSQKLTQGSSPVRGCISSWRRVRKRDSASDPPPTVISTEDERADMDVERGPCVRISVLLLV